MMDVWIARDGDGVVAQFFGGEPRLIGEEFMPADGGDPQTLRERFGHMRSGFRILPDDSFPEVKPGECRKAKITLEDK